MVLEPGAAEAGTQLVLKVNKGARTLVKTSTGKIGYMDAAWAKKICTMAAMNAPWALDAPKQAAASSDWGSGGNVIDNAAAIQDVVRAASEGGEASAASTQRLKDARAPARRHVAMIARTLARPGLTALRSLRWSRSMCLMV